MNTETFTAFKAYRDSLTDAIEAATEYHNKLRQDSATHPLSTVIACRLIKAEADKAHLELIYTNIK